MIPGEYLIDEGGLELNAGRDTLTLRVDNVSDRPVQIGSHTHFFEVNKELRFDRAKSYGFRLDVPAGTALRFEPGEGREVTLVAFGGERRAFGMNALVLGDLTEQRDEAMAKAKAEGYLADEEGAS